MTPSNFFSTTFTNCRSPAISRMFLLIAAIISLGPSSTTGLKINRLNVPLSVANGTSPLILGCEFDLEGETLYSVKWYKNYLEFYRFLPQNVPTPGETMEMKGISVDVLRSNSTHVWLNVVDLDSEGIFTCEISTESPSYQSLRAEEIMQVYVLPTEPTRIEGNTIHTKLDVGDFINVTCVSGPSKPPASLSWYINGDQARTNQVSHFPLQQSFPSSSGLQVRRFGLTIQASSDLFSKGQLKLVCSSRIILAYHYDSSRILTSARTSGSNVHHLSSNRRISSSNSKVEEDDDYFSSHSQDSSAFYMTDGYNVQRTRESPTITGGKVSYRLNDWVDLNCSTTAHSTSILRWFVNDIDAGSHSTVQYSQSSGEDDLQVTSTSTGSTRRKSAKKSQLSRKNFPFNRGYTLGLRLQIKPIHLQSQQLTLRCQSITYDVLQESSTSLKITSNNYQAIEGQQTSMATSRAFDGQSFRILQGWKSWQAFNVNVTFVLIVYLFVIESRVLS